jgi:hypothetical protein
MHTPVKCACGQVPVEYGGAPVNELHTADYEQGLHAYHRCATFNPLEGWMDYQPGAEIASLDGPPAWVLPYLNAPVVGEARS